MTYPPQLIRDILAQIARSVTIKRFNGVSNKPPLVSWIFASGRGTYWITIISGQKEFLALHGKTTVLR